MKKFPAILLLVLFLIPVPVSLAEIPQPQDYVTPEQYNNLKHYIEVARNDPSLAMLSEVLGGIEGIIPGQQTPLNQMFLIFNTAVAAVAVIFIVYSVGSATLQTAHEGEFLGRRYSSLWMPVRMVIGGAGIWPAFGGWSFAQIVMFWATALGIGIGSITWQVGSAAMLGTIHTPIVTPQAVINDKVVQSLVKAQLCAIGFNDERDRGGEVFKDDERLTAQPRPDEKNLSYAVTYGGTSKEYRADACGGVKIPNVLLSQFGGPKENFTDVPNSNSRWSGSRIGEIFLGEAPVIPRKAIFAAHVAALNEMVKRLWVVSQAIYEGRDVDPVYFADIKNLYNNQVGQELAQVALNANSSFGRYMRGDGASWMSAGIIFLKIASVNRDIIDAADIDYEVIQPSRSSRGLLNRWSSNVMTDGMSKGIEKYDAYRESIDEKIQETAKGEGLLSRLMGSAMDSAAINGAIRALTWGADDVMTAAVNFGYSLLNASGAGLMATFGVSLFVEKVGSVGSSVSGTIAVALMFVSSLLVTLMVMGGIFAFYLPFVPSIIWFGALLSWMVIVIEAVIAAPLWMITHLDPEGEGAAGAKAAHGYLFILNLIFRPTLLVISLVAAWGLANVFWKFLKKMLAVVYGSSGYAFSGFASIFMFIFIIGVFAAMMLYLFDKCFGLVHVIPTQVFAWLGGHNVGTGGGELDRVSNVIEGGATFMRDGASKRQTSRAKQATAAIAARRSAGRGEGPVE